MDGTDWWKCQRIVLSLFCVQDSRELPSSMHRCNIYLNHYCRDNLHFYKLSYSCLNAERFMCNKVWRLLLSSTDCTRLMGTSSHPCNVSWDFLVQPVHVCRWYIGEKGVGKSGKPLHFKGSTFHRVIPNFMVNPDSPLSKHKQLLLYLPANLCIEAKFWRWALEVCDLLGLT